MCTQTVTVTDGQPPTITCPAAISIPTGPTCSRVVTYAAAVGSDNCGSPTITYSTPSGSVFAVGSTTVTATATDASGQKSTCSFLVTVTDPNVICILCTYSWGYWKIHDRRSALANCGLTGSSLFYPCGCMSKWAQIDQNLASLTTVDSWDELLLFSQTRPKAPQLWQLIEQYEALYLSLASRGVITCTPTGSFSWTSTFVPAYVKGNFTLAFELMTNCPFPVVSGVAGVPTCLATSCSPCSGSTTCGTCPDLITKKGLPSPLYALISQIATALGQINNGLVAGAPHC